MNDITGKRYGMLTVVSLAGKDKHGALLWNCKCDCGTEKVIVGNSLKSGATVSCGCKKSKIHSGDRFGRLTAVESVREGKNTFWICKCDCGNTVKVFCGNLRRGNSLSCGCLARELTSQSSKTHGRSDTRLYGIWTGMKQRCYNPHVRSFRYYGEQGIGVCEAWQDYQPFELWAMANGYNNNMTIDRIDNKKDYSPDNCRWITRTQQMRNMTTNSLLTYKGETLTIAEWASKININPSTLSNRKRSGWSDEECIETPLYGIRHKK